MANNQNSKQKKKQGAFPPAYNESEQEQQQHTYNKQRRKHTVKAIVHPLKFGTKTLKAKIREIHYTYGG